MLQGGSLRDSRDSTPPFLLGFGRGLSPLGPGLPSHPSREGFRTLVTPPPCPRGVGPVGVGTLRVVSSSSIRGGGEGKPSPLGKVLKHF